MTNIIKFGAIYLKKLKILKQNGLRRLDHWNRMQAHGIRQMIWRQIMFWLEMPHSLMSNYSNSINNLIIKFKFFHRVKSLSEHCQLLKDAFKDFEMIFSE